MISREKEKENVGEGEEKREKLPRAARERTRAFLSLSLAALRRKKTVVFSFVVPGRERRGLACQSELSDAVLINPAEKEEEEEETMDVGVGCMRYFGVRSYLDNFYDRREQRAFASNK